MDISGLEKLSEYCWRLPPTHGMNAPVILYADRSLLEAMDEQVLVQSTNVARLPGIVGASYTMPDGHWGYGFPIGGVAAFDAAAGGVVSAGGVGFDISCGVRTLRLGVSEARVAARADELADALFAAIPAGVGSTGALRLGEAQMDDMLQGGARWAVEQGYGEAADLTFIEEGGCMPDADAGQVSHRAKRRQRDEMGTLGSGNHYLEVQRVAEVLDAEAASAFGLAAGDAVMSIHCGSRGLGHQIGTEYLREMAEAARAFGIALPERELACAPIDSDVGRRYLGAMAAGVNCALANRQIVTHLARHALSEVLPGAEAALLYDVSHNTCKLETHRVEGAERRLHVHRKGATRAFPPGHPDLPEAYRGVGQPVLIGGTMGTESYVLAGCEGVMERSFGSACHGAGRRMSRRQANRQWGGTDIVAELHARGIEIRGHSRRGIAEEAPGAYKDVRGVVEAAEAAGLARRVARLEPMICIKG
ncbi:RtcB family protein [Ectothiorhodospiraceae bacterium WFHF3C12]|nr:RtcB family protein [Ectothiorhodospiraceae bacterium WFHF3C12]